MIAHKASLSMGFSRQEFWSGLPFPLVRYSHIFKNFPQFVVIHIVKGVGVVDEAEVDVYLEFSCFSCDSVDAGNLISGSAAFSKSNMNI